MNEKINIHIGDYYASREPAVIQTILGSCVSVCLFDKKNRIGGMNHILLPGKPDLNRIDPSARYGMNAMELLINRMMSLGGDRRQIVAKVFGGAHIIPVISPDNSVGQRIAEFVKAFLQREEIKIVSQNIGGDKARKVLFYTNSGNVYVKYIDNRKNSEIFVREKIVSNHIEMELKTRATGP